MTAPGVLPYSRCMPIANGWLPGGPGHAHDEHEYDVDRGEQHSGTASAVMRGKDGSSSWACMSQPVKADHYRGQRVRFSAWVKTCSTSDGVWLWMRGDGSGQRTTAFDNMGTRLIRDTTDWTQYAIVLDIPAETEVLHIGFGLNGSGTAWFDDAALEVVGTDVPTTDRQVPLRPVNLNFEGA
jgi:hypothetical protein